MFRHHGTGSRRALHHDMPGETPRIALPPLWTGTVLAHQPAGDPAPAGTTPPAAPAVTFTPEQQAYVDQMVEGRLQRDRAARPPAPPNLAQLQQDSAELARLREQTGTDQQRAVAEATRTATAAAQAELLPQLVAAEIRAASGGSLTAEQATGIVAPLNPAYFQAPDGTVDRTKVAGYIQTLPTGGPPAATAAAGDQPGTAASAPSAAQPVPTPPAAPAGPVGVWPWPALGQGQHPATPPSGKDVGRAMAAEHFGDQTQSARRSSAAG